MKLSRIGQEDEWLARAQPDTFGRHDSTADYQVRVVVAALGKLVLVVVDDVEGR